MKKSGYADLPLHNGRVPYWLAQRMVKIGRAITEAIIAEYGYEEVLRRLSDPRWFQALGCVMGMDWHSSGITTSVVGALKKGINPVAHDLGLYVCGGRGKHSRQTPDELIQYSDQTGLDGHQLVHSSKLSAKVDNTAIQDGFQLYLHAFFVSYKGNWTVVQQGMNDHSGKARRYHWHSAGIKSFVESPHTFIYGENFGQILNLTDKEAKPTRKGILDITRENPTHMLQEIQKIVMPRHHEVRAKDVDLKRLGNILAMAKDAHTPDFENLLLLKGLGPRTLQSLTLVSEVIHGTPSRFSDPARFSFAHGGKDGHPHPVPTKVYDQTISVLENAVQKAKIEQSDKQKALKKLHQMALEKEKQFIPAKNKEKAFNQYVQKEHEDSWKYGGRTVFGKSKPPKGKADPGQLGLFD